MPTLFVVINCGACAPFIGRCLASLRSQTFERWRALVTVDPCGDPTFEEACVAARGDLRIHVRQNERRLYALENLVNAIRLASPNTDDIIVNLDGDDWLNTDHALATVVETYAREECWMTYGSWVSDTPGRRSGMWPAYAAGTEDFRAAPWLATHLRTWQAWLWNLVEDHDLRDDDDRYFRAASDLAVMIPLLEHCSTSRARHIAEPLYYLNRQYAWRTDHDRYQEQQRNERIIRSRPPYPRLHERPS